MISWLNVRGVRNLSPQRVELGSDLVVVVGSNAQGKTSLLESAYLLATTRSFRTRDARELIRHGDLELNVEGGLELGAEPGVRLGITVPRARGNRRLTVGEYEAELVDYLDHLPALVMAGESIRSTAKSPSERRRYMDRATAAAQPAHLEDLADFRRALSQRNRLLRDQASEREIDPWDEVLARAGAPVSARRKQQLESWQTEIVAWPELFPEGGRLQVVYRESGEKPGDGDTDLLTRIRAARGVDRRLAVTTVGPHRDDLILEVDGKNLWRFGSSGQIRSAIAALVLAQARAVARARSPRRPLLILDDVETDLDPSRFSALLTAARGEGQVLAATSKPHLVDGVGGRHLIVRCGKVSDA